MSHGSARPGQAGAFSAAGLSYFERHAIDPKIASVLGVVEANGAIVYPYRDGDGPFERRRPLDGGRTFQPKGRLLALWTPCGVDGVALVCEGETDLLAAASVLYEVEDLAADGDDEEDLILCHRGRSPIGDLPDVLAQIVPVAIPGAGAAHQAVAELLDKEVSDAFVVLDGDDAGRHGAEKLKTAIDATGGTPNPAVVVELPDGSDLADCLQAADDRVEWLANALADAEAAAAEAQKQGADHDPDVDVDTQGDRDKPAKPGRTIAFPQVEPWPEPVPGADLAAELAEAIGRHVAVGDEAITSMSMWVLFAHVHDSSPISPILAATSPTKRCGKTTTINVISRFVPRPLPSVNITAAALFRVIEAARPTLLIDEADTFLGAKEELRGILNSGHARGAAFVIRTVGEGANAEVRQFATWAPKMLAQIGELPDTLSDRSIRIRLERRTAGERVESLRGGDDRYQGIRRKLARWAEDNPDVAGGDPELPAGLHDRAQDNWRPLLSIADVLGGAWPERTRAAAMALEGEEPEELTGTLLLADLREIFDAGENKIMLSTSMIVEALTQREDRPWPEWSRGKPLSATGLAKLLRPFGVRPRNLKVDGAVMKGYRRSQLNVVWARYLPGAATPLLPSVHAENSGSQAATPADPVAAPNGPDPAPQAQSSGVAATNGGPAGWRIPEDADAFIAAVLEKFPHTTIEAAA